MNLKNLAVAATLMATVSLASAGTPRFSPATHNFGNVPVGSSVTININLDLASGSDTLRNLGIDQSPTLSDNAVYGDFVLARSSCVSSWDPTGTPLSPGVGCPFTLTYTPTAAGPAAAMITATDRWNGHWGTMNITAVGVAAPVTPATIPTLSEWGLILTSAMVGLFGFAWIRRRS